MKTIGKLLSWSLYYLGHWSCLIAEKTESVTVWNAYNWLMCKSSDVQDKYGSGPWTVIE